jgi:type IV pilus assembly protein PilW
VSCRSRTAFRRSRGFSMIELMIAVVLALVVSAAAIAVFVASRSSYLSTSGTAALADSGRFALDLIQGSVRSAGFMACNTTARQATQLATPSSPVYANFTEALGGFEAVNSAPGGAYATSAAPVSLASPVTTDPSTGDWLSPSGVAPSGLDPALANKVLKNNDVLVVYSTLRNAQSVYLTAPISVGDTGFTVSSAGSLVGGQLATISDCSKSLVVWISSAGGTSIGLSSGTWPNNSQAGSLLSFEVGSQVAPVDATVFYIGKGADGDGALFSYDLQGGGTFTANELVPDIEAMQVLYGMDTTGTQTVSEYVTADQVVTTSNPILNFNNVISVKVAVLAASQIGAVPMPAFAPTFSLLGTTVTPPRDTRARQVFELTIGIRNMAQ